MRQPTDGLGADADAASVSKDCASRAVYNYAMQSKGFVLYEAESEEQLSNVYYHYPPLVKYEVKPISESTDTIAANMKSKR